MLGAGVLAEEGDGSDASGGDAWNPMVEGVVERRNKGNSEGLRKLCRTRKKKASNRATPVT